jgi:hypothetical protein
VRIRVFIKNLLQSGSLLGLIEDLYCRGKSGKYKQSIDSEMPQAVNGQESRRANRALFATGTAAFGTTEGTELSTLKVEVRLARDEVELQDINRSSQWSESQDRCGIQRLSIRE